jgi:molecular chaperone Hsp33
VSTPEGRLIRALAHEQKLRVLAVVADQPVNDIVQRHELSGRAAQLCAEGIVASLLLSAHIKGDERLMVQVQGEQPRFSFMADVRSDGRVRARLRPTSLPEGTALSGTLHAAKWLKQKEVYRGSAAVEQDWQGSMARYLTDSQQSLGMVRLGVKLNEQGQVVFASGLLIESVGGSGLTPEEFEALVGPLRSADLGEVMTIFAFGQLQGAQVEVLEARPVVVNCGGTTPRIEAMLRSLGAPELQSILEEQGQAEVTCDWCNDQVVIGPERLRELIAEVS